MFSSFITDALCYVKFLLDDTWNCLLLWIQHSFNTSAWMWIKKNTMLDMFYWQYCLCLGDNASLFIQVRSNIVLANHLIKEIYRFKLSWFIDHDINCKVKPSFVIYLSLLWKWNSIHIWLADRLFVFCATFSSFVYFLTASFYWCRKLDRTMSEDQQKTCYP